MRFYDTPLTGTGALDGIDIRQIPVDDLRQSITYANGANEHFYGTIFQNFRLAAPDITEERATQAIVDMGLKYELETMPEGIHTRLTEAFRASMSDSTLRGLALALRRRIALQMTKTAWFMR